ncbi:MAG: membrane protein [Planctomycetota bacterium]|nr:MAG: membrane protein [Planctomycetota bacterium]
MGFDAAFTLGVLLVTVVLLALERFPVELVALLGFLVLVAAGVLTPDEAYQAFSNPAPIAIAGMLVLSAGLERTGAIDRVADFLRLHPGRSERHLLLLALPVVMLLSAFLNNTPIVVMFTPVLMRLSREHGTSPGRVLIPLSYAAILGGTCTLIGTSTNLVVDSILQDHALPALGMFEFALLGVPLAALGLLYMLTVGPRLLPHATELPPPETAAPREYLAELRVSEGSPLIGQRLLAGVSPLPPGAAVLEIQREGSRLLDSLDSVFLRSDDRLLVAAPQESFHELRRLKGVKFQEGAVGLGDDGRQREAIVFQAIVGPGSRAEGRTLRDLELRQRYGAVVLSVHRHGRRLEGNLSEIPLAFGDTLTLVGTPEARERLRLDQQFLLLGDVVAYSRPRAHRLWLSASILAAVVVVAAVGPWPLAIVALIGAVLTVLLGCLEPREAYRAVNLPLLLLIIGMLGIGTALEKTHAARQLVDAVIGPLQALGPELGPFAVLASIVLMTSVLTEFVTNNATAAIMTPIAITAAHTLQIPVTPLAFGVAFASSAGFATPVGYQTNAFVYAAGGYRFRHFLRAGLPLKLLVWVATVLLIPVFWPLS